MKLLAEALFKFLLGVLLVGVLIFLPAGTLAFFNGWLLMGILFVPMLVVGTVLLCKNPALLKKRLDAKEEDPQQRRVVKQSGLMFLLGFAVAGFNFRFEWYTLPTFFVLLAAGVFICAYLLYAEVLRENTHLSRTVAVSQNQTVVSSGLYGVVRHPMYSATVLLFLSIPLVLGSLYAFPIFLAYPFILIKRIRHEEALLEQQLEGYRAYRQKVKYRLIPFVW